MNSLIKIFAVLIAVLLLYLYPLSAAFDQQDDISELVALRATTAQSLAQGHGSSPF